MEMQFDNIKKQITEADPNQQKEIIDLLSGTKVGQDYASNIAQSYWNENIKAHDKKFYDGIDEKLNKLGFQRQEGLKTSEFLIQIALKNKELAEKLEAVSQDPDKSKKTLQDLVQKHKDEIEQITNNYNKAIQVKDAEIDELNQKQVVSLKSSTIDKGIAEYVSFSKGFSDEMIRDIVKLKKQELMNHSRVENDTIIWCDENGLPIKGPNGVTNATLSEVLYSKFNAYLESSKPGGGAGKNSPQGSNFTDHELHVDMSSVKTRLQFLAAFEKVAQANGISKEDDNHHTLYIDAKKRYNIDALPEY